MKFYFLIGVILGWVSPSFGAYRVFQLRIYVYDSEGKRIENTYSILSNLDHQQYQNYHAGNPLIKVVTIDSWYCPGDTRGFRKYCSKPKIKEFSPTLERAKRVNLPWNLQPVVP